MDLHAFKMLLVYLIGCLAVVRASSNDRPILQEITLPRKLVENQNIKLNCDLTQGAKPIKLSWFFNDAPIKENERLQIDNRRDDVSSLVIKSLSSDSVGRYKCVATNDYGSDQQTGTVHVNTKPVITSELRNVTGLLNQPVALDCQAKGYPKVETKWSRIMENEIKEYQSNRLEFNVTKQSAGQYTCTAWNSNGRTEKSIHVDYYAPKCIQNLDPKFK